jgi:hypothetical protein
MLEKVLEKLGTTESTTLTLKREDGGKIRVTSLLWESPKVILRGEVLEIRNVDGVLHIAGPAVPVRDRQPLRLLMPRGVSCPAASTRLPQAPPISTSVNTPALIFTRVARLETSTRTM